MTAAVRAARREPRRGASGQRRSRIPYTAHIAPNIVCTESGDYVEVFKLSGASFESADDEVLNNWHERLNVLWRNIASPNVALWAHVVRRRERTQPCGTDDSGFASRLAGKYRAKLSTETLMVNDLYLSAVYRPVAGRGSGHSRQAAFEQVLARDRRQRGGCARRVRKAGANAKQLSGPIRAGAALDVLLGRAAVLQRTRILRRTDQLRVAAYADARGAA